MLQVDDATKKQLAAAGGPLRMGIIGCGVMGREHIRNIALLGEEVAYVSAVADPFEKSRKEAVEDLGARSSRCQVYASYSDLLASDNVDAVVICVPNFRHIDVLRETIPKNKHILCEKPLCISMEECSEVGRLLRERNASLPGGVKPGVFMTGMEYRWMPPIQALLRETDSGSLGPLHTVFIREHRFPFLDKVEHWNRFNRYTGGTLVEKACHFFDLMRRIVRSEPVKVYASGGQAVNHRDEKYEEGVSDIIDHAFATVDFASGARAVLDLNMFAEDHQTEHVIVVGERGKAEAKAPESTLRVVKRNRLGGDSRIPPLPNERAVPELQTFPVAKELEEAGYHEGSTWHELKAFVLASRGLQPVPISANDGKAAVAMGLAAQESMKSGRPVQLDPSAWQEQPQSKL